MAGKFSATITAAALVLRAAAAYLGLATKVSSDGPACSMPLRPVISVSGAPLSRRAFSAETMRESFMRINETRVNRTPVSGWSLGACFGQRASIAGQFALDFAGDGDETNHARGVFEHQGRASGIHDCGDEVAVRSWNAAMGRGLVVAWQLSFFHASHADEADGAVGVFEDEASANLVGDGCG